MAEQKSSSALTAPLRGAASVLRRVPGAGTVSRAATETLDKVGAVSPRGRRIAVYAGAGVLGAAGLVEWPVALTGAAVAWLTQPRPAQPADGGAGQSPAHDLGTAALGSGHGGTRTGGADAAAEAEATGGPWDAGAAEAGVEAAGAAEASGESRASGGPRTRGSGRAAGGNGSPGSASRTSRTTGGTGSTGTPKTAGSARTARAEEGSAAKPSSGPLGPTARPDRTTL
ncbi:hypothetical protein AB0L59_15785 [Streptomyces sp. NPDC052109]|uniref:hypothetical protein n=1 Tax=Streptomyces sp. NPDC052109 TaxID=3155527 RepID=UPI00343E880C